MLCRCSLVCSCHASIGWLAGMPSGAAEARAAAPAVPTHCSPSSPTPASVRLAFSWCSASWDAACAVQERLEHRLQRMRCPQDAAPAPSAWPVFSWEAAQVRLEHMLQRLRCLQDAAATAAPSRLLPHLFISGAVPASSFHVLRHLGITHILNATQDLPEPPPSAGFTCAAAPSSCQAVPSLCLTCCVQLGVPHVLEAGRAAPAC